jgi:hypothetical protein
MSIDGGYPAILPATGRGRGGGREAGARLCNPQFAARCEGLPPYGSCGWGPPPRHSMREVERPTAAQDVRCLRLHEAIFLIRRA